MTEPLLPVLMLCPPPWGLGHIPAFQAPSFPLDSPLRNLAWPRGLALSTFSHPKSEALGTTGKEGAVGPYPSLALRLQPLLPAKGSGESQVAL